MASKYKGPHGRLAQYEALVATNPDLERKGVTSPYTSRNGWMFSFLDLTGSMSLRLSEADRAEFLATYDSSVSVQHGKPMKEFVVVPDSLLENQDLLAPWFALSYEWIGTLKPKPTKRKPPKK